MRLPSRRENVVHPRKLRKEKVPVEVVEVAEAEEVIDLCERTQSNFQVRKRDLQLYQSILDNLYIEAIASLAYA